MPNDTSTFIKSVRQSVSDGTFHRLTLSSRSDKTSDCVKVIIKPISMKQGTMLSFVNRYATKDITKNYATTEGLAMVQAMLSQFLDACLFSTTEDLSLRRYGKKYRLSSKAPTFSGAPSLTPDRIKKRIVPTENNVYLKELGVLTDDFSVKAKMHDKYRQICKFVEIFDSIVRKWSTSKQIRAIDMGAGKGYLTFAMYEYLEQRNKGNSRVVGIENRGELVDDCNRIASMVGFEKLSFERGTIEDADIADSNVLIALHACDTATDDAIYRGIQANMDLIICAPCCHKQLRSQMNAKGDLASILQHGILLERQAEILTDGIRALLLQAFGYRTRVFEFIFPSHTAKNIMIVGERIEPSSDRQRVLQTIKEINDLYGIEQHYLEKLLKV
jgi:hypothetical protein